MSEPFRHLTFILIVLGIILMNQTLAVISNVNQGNFNVKMDTASIRFKSVTELINVATIQRKERIANDLLASINTLNALHRQTELRSASKISKDAMEFR